jgi:hypothetical protein
MARVVTDPVDIADVPGGLLGDDDRVTQGAEDEVDPGRCHPSIR